VRRIAPPLVPLLACLALASGASASSGTCPNFAFHGFTASRITHEAMGCYVAGLVIRHVIDRAQRGFHTLTCSREGARWHCSLVSDGNHQSVSFVLQRHAVTAARRG
jgi:hypothetical protein